MNIVGNIGKRVTAKRSDVLEARAVGHIVRALGIKDWGYREPTGWVGRLQSGQQVKIKPYFDLRNNIRVDGGYFREGRLVWEGQYRLTSL